MMGYLNRQEATKYALRKESNETNWLYTSDIGCIDKDGYLRLKDRKRDMIKYKGNSVFPRGVKELIYMNKAVDEVAVVGVPDPIVGENIKVYVSLRPEYRGKISEEELLEWCQENISPYKYPGIVEILHELPKTVIGKILKRELREIYN